MLALLLAPWPGLDTAFCGGYCRFANALWFQRQLDSGLSLRLEPATPGTLESARTHVAWHALLRVEAPSTQRVTRLGFNTRSTSYVPGAAFVAFVLASRAWKRTRAAGGILVGALVTLAFSALALTLSTVRFLGLPRVGGFEFGESFRALLDTVFLAWIVPPGMAYAAPLLAGSLMLWLSRSRRPET